MQNNELKKLTIRIQQDLIKQARNLKGFDRDEINKSTKTILTTHIYNYLKEQGISGHGALLNAMNLLNFKDLAVEKLVKGHELNMFIESLEKLGVPEKDCMQRIQDIKDSLSILINDVQNHADLIVSLNEFEESEKLSAIEKSKPLKKVIAKIALCTVIVIGAIASLIGLAALAIATGVAPAVLVTAATGIGITAATSVTIGGVTIGLAGMGGTIAATGAVTTAIASVGVGKAMKAIEASAQKSKDQTHIEIDSKLAKALSEGINKQINECDLIKASVQDFMKNKAIAQRG